MDQNEIAGILEFLRGAEKLKQTTRNSWTSDGRREDVAAHTWRLSLMAMLFARAYPEIDVARLLEICIVHDLGEAVGGDIPAIEQAGKPAKAEQERADLLQLVAPLPAALQSEVVALWDEYEAATSREAKLAKAFDKLETIMQHNQGRNPDTFDFRFNLGYGRQHTAGDPLIEELRRILDEETEDRARAGGPPS